MVITKSGRKPNLKGKSLMMLNATSEYRFVFNFESRQFFKRIFYLNETCDRVAWQQIFEDKLRVAVVGVAACNY